MGVDRIFAIEALESDGVIVDAGSAVTVDVVKEGTFVGGFIYPGIKAMHKTYENISDALSYSFNFDLALDIMPKNSRDAISYGYLKTLYAEVVSHRLPIILTGGDAKEFAKIFKDATIDEQLIFKGMKKIIQRADIC
jgi:type III pantothenate kinase